ncbi:MAG: chromosome segregation protein SMC [Gemmataceae bacterium]
MLKRLELVGFKSFADKTQFDFAEGVTGIIGPNGSGKSNVVDAVRWVLGEQSARSLRGGEMTDVIFNGSASRRSLGMAEVSMIFDNRRSILATDSEEVRITRRVYRSGEGEYLINNHPCRLKDIKDLFLGSGAGTDAYCIIQQGQVDILLQTAPKERRTIFEEAAGISRFKVRKIEAIRKLERVESNLQRLRDILEEVEKQLRSVKLQAAKAERFQLYTSRLKELRIGSSLREYHEVNTRFSNEAAALETLRTELQEESVTADNSERDLATVETHLHTVEQSLHSQETSLSETRQSLAGEHARFDVGQSTLDQHQEELARTRERLMHLVRQVLDLTTGCEQAQQERKEAEIQFRARQQAVEDIEESLADIEKRRLELREEGDRQEAAHLDQMRLAARRHNDAVAYKAQLDNLSRELARVLQRSEQAAEHLASLDMELEHLRSAEESLQSRLTQARLAQVELTTERDRLSTSREETLGHIADLRAERSGLVSRIEVLENLERSHEGLSTGVREVLTHLAATDPGPWRTVVGIVAELLSVRREYAPLIDLALGDRAQRFVVLNAEELQRALAERGIPFSGRVSFLQPPVTAEQPAHGTERTDLVRNQAGPGTLGDHPGVIAHAEQVVRCETPRFSALPRLLLGKTLIVRDLAAARAIQSVTSGYRCITLAGELLEPDGTLTVGTHHAEAGILSRKSELRDLREQLLQHDERLVEFEEDLNSIRERIEQLDTRIGHAGYEIAVLAEQANDMRMRIGQHQERREGLTEEVTLSQGEITQLEQETNRLREDWQRALDHAAEAEAAVASAKCRAEAIEKERRDLESQEQRQQQAAMMARVGLAQLEERLAGLKQRQAQLEADHDQRASEQMRLDLRIRGLVQKSAEIERELLQAGQNMADLYHRKESIEQALTQLTQERRSLRDRKIALNQQVQESRGTWRQRQENLRSRELTVNNLSHSREVLCNRIQEDYQVDLADLYQKLIAEGHQQALEQPLVVTSLEGEEPVTPEAEIAELKRKLSKLGNVNLEALDELRELEGRYSTLRIQFDDLTASQKTLQEIIDRINTDSRRLFTETFEAIRSHFQELFRKLFGGGMADIVLEEGVDILESGIEVIARPPGKELRSISLMSGGEKTMTAVALLLAIFQSKPSPFCILDEVDAALDEANVGRFTAVLRDFLNLSQFIIITHHKRTMSAADVLYGVTMAESGISSRFSVRFEDWPNDDAQVAAA